MGQVEIFQGHGADVIVIGHLHLILIAIAVRSGLRPVAHLHRNRFGQGVLPVKECLQLALYLVHREHPLMERRQNGDQHIGVMADGVQVKTVFVIAGVQGLIVVQLILKVRLQPRIGRLLYPPGCALGGGRRILRRFPCLAYLFGIVPLDTLFLQVPGDRVGGGQGRVLMERLLVEEIGVCPDRSPFRP